MKLGISNIAWKKENDIKIYNLMKQQGYCGLEIAPTRIFLENPYDKLDQCQKWRDELYSEYHFEVPSIQSIWFGRTENLFASEADRDTLLDYTKKAIDFASRIKCNNLVFGCPKNRNVPENLNRDLADEIATAFFRQIAEYALLKGTVIALEANPPIYNTNYINNTMEAVKIIRRVGSEGMKLNLDVGTMIQNGECVDEVESFIELINHVHISEPGLAAIKNRKLHERLARILELRGYDKFISIEMGLQSNLAVIKDSMVYVKEIFG